MFKQIQQSWFPCHCIAFTSLHHIILHSYHLTHVYPFLGGLHLLLDSSRGFLLTSFIKCETGIKWLEYPLELINMSLHWHIRQHLLHNRYRHSVLSLFEQFLATLSFLLCVDPVEYDGCVGVLIPSLRITNSRSHSLWSRDHAFSRFTLSVSFPSFGINNARWQLCCFLFSRRFFA